MTLRRLFVLVRALPYDAPLWAVMEAAEAPAPVTPDRIRERQCEWEARNNRAKEVADG